MRTTARATALVAQEHGRDTNLLFFLERLDAVLQESLLGGAHVEGCVHCVEGFVHRLDGVCLGTLLHGSDIGNDLWLPPSTPWVQPYTLLKKPESRLTT